MPSRILRLFALGLMLASFAAFGGCHMVEAISYDIEDGSAYTGDKIAEGGEHLAEWIRDLND